MSSFNRYFIVMACSGMALGGAIGYAGKILIHGEKSNDVPTVLQKFQKAWTICYDIIIMTQP